MPNKTVRAAIAAKEAGYEYAASIVKTVFYTTYYNVVPLEDIIKAGAWIPSGRGQFLSANGKGYWSGRLGQSRLPEKCILRQKMLRVYGGDGSDGGNSNSNSGNDGDKGGR